MASSDHPLPPVAVKTLIVLGLVLMAVAAADAALSRHRFAQLEHAHGKVSEIAETRAADGTIAQQTVVVWLTPDGGAERFTPAPYKFAADLTPGQDVTIAYPAGRPDDAEVQSTGREYGRAIVIALAGVALFDIGYAFWFVGRRTSLDPEAAQFKSQRASAR